MHETATSPHKKPLMRLELGIRVRVRVRVRVTLSNSRNFVIIQDLIVVIYHANLNISLLEPSNGLATFQRSQ
jgi:hypothetical protein